jgi:hypothetical protein
MVWQTMNERIKELADEAGVKYNLWVGSKPATYMTYDELEKFAELIVKECLDIVNRHEYSYHEADPLWETAQLIKQHFGVES